MAGRWPYAALFFSYFAFIGAYSPYLALYLQHQHFSALEIGILVSLLQAMRIVGPYGWGWLADRTHQPANLLRISALAAMPIYALLTTGDSFLWMFMILVFLNLSTAAQVPLAESIAIRSLQGDLTHYGRLRLWGSVGFIVSVLCMGAILDRVGMGWYPLLGVLVLWLLFMTTLTLPAPRLDTISQRAGKVGMVLRQRAVQLFLLSVFLMIFAHAALYAYYSLYLARLGFSPAFIGLMWALGVLAEIVFFFYQAQVLSRYALNTLLLWSFLICAARFFMIGLGASSLIILVLAQLLHAVTFGMHHGVSMALMQRWFGTGLTARGQALYVAVGYGLGGSLGGLAAAHWWEQVAPAAAFIAAAVVALLGAVVVLILRRYDAAPLQEEHE
jgi:PPP family 3-phenylpropionic acid transporter